MKVHHFHVRPHLPEPLLPLRDLAMNLWYSWNWEAVHLFIRLNPAVWEESYQNPVLMLGTLPQSDLDAAARDESFVASLNRVHGEMQAYMKAPGWFREAHGDAKDLLVAYFSCEFGLDEGLPVYSGGLGVLSGDHLKSASDLGLPLVGVGLLYQKGYFRQILNLDGWQQELYPDNDWFNMPVTLERGRDGRIVTIDVPMGGETVKARVWRVQVGRVPLYLLDANVPENPPKSREITHALYGGDRDMRIRQEILLGVGGVRALKALGLAPTVYHMNEGHSAFLAVERIRAAMEEHGATFAEAREQVAASNVFTTHTPVPAGNEVFGTDLLLRYLQPHARGVGLPWQEFLALGQDLSSRSPDFGMTVLALRHSAFANGVSRLHAETSRGMWKELWSGLPEAEVPIRHVTNGIHTRTWLSHEMEELLDRYMGPRFRERPADQTVWDRVESIPPSELWRNHETRRERLVFFVRKRLRRQLARLGAGAAALRAAEEVLNPRVLTIGFSRRFATYKRANLLFRHPERLVRLLTDPDRPVQIVFAGKAHPQDQPAKEIIKAVVHFAADPRVRQRLVFVEDYDINVARYFVQGVDVWLNTPRRPLEASGTSGMKAAANGGLNVSVLDGWWCEGYAPDSGWSIGSGEAYDDPEDQDRIESESLFNLLESEIVPLFYERDQGGLPREWIRMMKASMRRIGAAFNTHRMVREYAESVYLPAHRGGVRLAADGLARARSLAAWRARVAAGWPSLAIRGVEVKGQKEVPVGAAVGVVVRARIAPLAADDVSVEIWYGPLDGSGQIRDGAVAVARHERSEDGLDLFRAEIPCRVTGRYGYMARIVPRHPDLVNPLSPLLLTWEA